VLRARSTLIALKRHRQPGDPAIADAERDLRAEKLADHARKVAESFPPLTDAQRLKIASLLLPSST
jgi:hypothetical protein